MDIDISKIINTEGGKDGTWYRILAEEGRGRTKYFPGILPDGREGHLYDDFGGDLDKYLAAKQPRERVTIRVTVAGNAVSAESAIQRALGCLAMACTPNTVDIYPNSAPILPD